MEVPRATQTFPESGLRAAASGRDGVPDHIRSDTLLFVRWGQVGRDLIFSHGLGIKHSP